MIVVQLLLYFGAGLVPLAYLALARPRLAWRWMLGGFLTQVGLAVWIDIEARREYHAGYTEWYWLQGLNLVVNAAALAFYVLVLFSVHHRRHGGARA